MFFKGGNTMSRRGHGEGSIYQRGDGRYIASLTIAPGQRKYFYGQTRKEVQAKLRRALRELEEGVLATGPQQTVQTYLETWLKRCKSRLRPTTYISYRTCVNCRLLPAFGHLKLTSLNASQIEAFYDAECQKVSPNMVRLIHTVFKKALQDAVKSGCCRIIPARMSSRPGAKSTRARCFRSNRPKRCWRLLPRLGSFPSCCRP
jgi:integrase